MLEIENVRDILLSKDIVDFDLAVELLVQSSIDIKDLQDRLKEFYKEESSFYNVACIDRRANRLYRFDVHYANSSLYLKDPTRIVMIVSK